MSTIKVRVPGTTANCGPGFDAIGIACTMYNDLTVSVTAEQPLAITVLGEGAASIPTDSSNIAWQAMQAVFAAVGRSSYDGIQMTMHNHIPLARGLGSSAAAIVAGLIAGNAISGSHLSPQDLFDMATAIEGHPDNVAPALFGGITVSVMDETATGNTQAQCLRFMPPAALKMVAAIPDFTLATTASREVLPDSVPLRDAVFNVGRAALLIGALCQGEFDKLQYACKDRLHQPYRQPLIPGMPEVLEAALAQGALAAVLSGAGPCLLAFATDNLPAIGEAMTAAFAAHNVPAQFCVLAIDAEGAKIML